MSGVVTQIVNHPIDTTQAMLTPPPGTNSAVKGLYYAQDAQLAIAATKGVKSGAIKLTKVIGGKEAEIISKNMLDKIGTTSLKRFAYKAIRNVGISINAQVMKLMEGPEAAKAFKASEKAANKAAADSLDEATKSIEAASKAAGKQIATSEARAAARASLAGERIVGVELGEDAISAIVKPIAEKAAEKAGITVASMIGRMLAVDAVFAALEPVGAIIDAILMTAQVFGLVYTLLDKSGMGTVLGPADINSGIQQIIQNSDANMTNAGVPNYYSDPAEFPVVDLVFQWDPTSNSYMTTPEWGPMYSGLLDKYMATQGFGSDWRNYVDASPMLGKSKDGTTPVPNTGPSPTLILIIILVFLFVLALIGGLFFIISS